VANLNRIILIGKLLDNPEVRSSMEGTGIAKFKLSVTRFGGAGSDVVDIVAWSNQAETAGRELKQGDMALVEGRIQIRSFTNQAGERNWATEVVASDLKPFAFSKKAVATAAAKSSDDEIEELPEDDLPF